VACGVVCRGVACVVCDPVWHLKYGHLKVWVFSESGECFLRDQQLSDVGVGVGRWNYSRALSGGYAGGVE
jgi:hypothetical protein